MDKLSQIQKSLLNSMVNDEKLCNKKLYSAGPYWNYKTKKILYWLKKKGIKNFRGLNSSVGSSYSDNIVLDYRNELGFRGRMLGLITYLPLINKIYESQIKRTYSYIQNYIKQNAIAYKNNERVKSLISKYIIKDTVKYDCALKFEYQGEEYSSHYLNLCDRLDIISKYINYKNVSTFFEIGGGFGSYVHLLLNNFPNMKKVLYLDMVPNLFLGTE